MVHARQRRDGFPGHFHRPLPRIGSRRLRRLSRVSGGDARTAGSSTPTPTTTATQWSSGSGTSTGRTGSRTRGPGQRSSCMRHPTSCPQFDGGSRSSMACGRCARSRGGSPSRTTSRSPSWRSCRGISATSATSRTSSTRTAGTWTAEEEHFALEYPLPSLRKSLLDIHVDNPAGIPRMQDKLLGARLDDVEIDGDEEAIVRGIGEAVRSTDPDILMTDGGDAFTMPYLARKAADLGVDMKLGRDPDKFAERKGKSYFTYGKIVYKPGQYILRGRLHLDRGHFAMRESDFAGLAELSRLSTLTPQEQARLTPGTAFSAMQVNLAYHDGRLVIWKKNRPEEFKDAENLLRGDRGGFTFEPEVGVHEGLYELDFSSLYPSIMVKYNISAETLDCACCPTDGLPVPELRYHLCTRRVGIVGRVLKPLIERRRYYKKMKKEPGPLQDVYTGRDTILKWTLVTCYDGRTVIPYKMGDERYQKPISEIIDPLLPAGGMADAPAELRLFGF